MKIFATFTLVLLLSFNAFSAAWGNGGKSKALNKPIFGSHDWIAFEGFKMANKDHKLDWLSNNLNAFFIGTEAPDLGASLMPGAGPGYKDTTTCHCILFAANGGVTNDKIERRAQEEFDKAKARFGKPHPTKKDLQLAAFYLGAMAHYLGDLSQFMHLMGKQSHWGSEDQQVHHRYEEVVDKSILFTSHSSSLLSVYVMPKDVDGTSAKDIALSVARFTETGGGSSHTPGSMYLQFQSYIKKGTAIDAAKWDKEFLDQTGANVNTAISGIAKLMAAFEKN